MRPSTSRHDHVDVPRQSSTLPSHSAQFGSASVLLGTMASTLLIAIAVIFLAAMNSPIDPAQASAVILSGTVA